MLARALARAFNLRGITPVLLDRNSLDVIGDGEAIHETLDKYKPSLVLNCAAYTKVDQAEVERERAMLVNDAQVFTSICREYAKKYVHYSTDFVFDGASTRPYRPSDPTNPLSVYGQSKLGGEEMVREHFSDYLIIRTAWLYGPDGPNFVRTMLNAAWAGKPLRVVNDQIGSPTFTHDLAEATLNLIDAGATGIFHVTNSGQTTWFDFTRAILEEFDLKADLAPPTSAEWKQLRPNSATRPAYSVLDCSDYERVTGKKLPHWREALHRYRLALSSG